MNHNLLEQYNSFYLTKINRLENELIDIEKEIKNILLSIATVQYDDFKVAIDYMYTIKNYYGIVCDLCGAYTYIKIKPPESLYYFIAKLTSANYLSAAISKIRDITSYGDFSKEYNVFYDTLKVNISYLKNINIDCYRDIF